MPAPASQRIDTAVAARAMLNHPFYRAWSEGRLTTGDLAAYAAQYRPHVEAFPRAVARTYLACDARLSARSYAAGLGALYACESQLPDVSTTKIDGLKRFHGVHDAETLRFFTVHEAADVEHAQVCRGLLDRLPPAEADDAAEAGAELAEALWGFLDGVSRLAGVEVAPARAAA